MNLTQIYRDPDLEAEMQRKVWDSCIREGRAARAIGQRIDECPPFKDSDMAVSWQMGWHQENEERKPKVDK